MDKQAELNSILRIAEQRIVYAMRCARSADCCALVDPTIMKLVNEMMCSFEWLAEQVAIGSIHNARFYLDQVSERMQSVCQESEAYAMRWRVLLGKPEVEKSVQGEMLL